MNGNGGGEQGFGSCCGELKEALTSEDFEPLITVGEDDVLYMSVGIIDTDDEESSIVDHPVFFCPFCGAKVQSPDEVKAKVKAETGDDD